MVYRVISVFSNKRDNDWFIGNRPIEVNLEQVMILFKYRFDSRYKFVLSNAVEV